MQVRTARAICSATVMNLEMRQELARAPFEKKIRKVGQLVRLAKTAPRLSRRPNGPVPCPENKSRISNNEHDLTEM